MLSGRVAGTLWPCRDRKHASTSSPGWLLHSRMCDGAGSPGQPLPIRWESPSLCCPWCFPEQDRCHLPCSCPTRTQRGVGSFSLAALPIGGTEASRHLGWVEGGEKVGGCWSCHLQVAWGGPGSPPSPSGTPPPPPALSCSAPAWPLAGRAALRWWGLEVAAAV